MRIARLALAAVAVSLAGCGSWNPLVAIGFMNEPPNKPTKLAPINASVTPRAVWSTKVGKSRGFDFRPAYSGGRIYAADGDGAISSLDEDTGKIASRIETKKRLSGGVEVGEGMVVAGTMKGEVVAYDVGGKQRWEAKVGGEVIAPAAVSNKVVVIRTSDGRIMGLSADDGKRKWIFQRQSPSLLLRSAAGLLAIGHDVVAGYPNGKLIALDIDTGQQTWEVTVSLPRGATELERIADVAGLPAVDGGNVCAGAYQGKVACFDIVSRNQLWSRDVSTSRTVGVDKKNIYIVDDANAVQALDKASGASVWKQDKLVNRRLTAPVMLDGRVVVGDLDGYLHVLSPDNGEIIGRMATDGTQVTSIVPIAGALIVQTAGGTVALVKI
ncbi:MAG TPA: outer membrane protein assembly factor BamB [Usitatibacter sp.]|jgi:outer membrane protein assembly factor BamB|nr:outer membrane protein assembly factor BamB [Usitatibacter sp.]